MGLTDQEVRDILKERRILIVEDDSDLAKRLVRLFHRRYKTLKPVVKGCMNGAKEGGLDALRKDEPPYDLAIVDVRLPLSEKQLADNRGLEEEWSELQAQLMEYPGVGEEDDTPDLEDLRAKIDAVHRAMRNNIDDWAGINMVKEWVKEMKKEEKKKSDNEWRQRTGILYLTARSDQEAQEAAERAVGICHWLTKPVSSKTLAQEAAGLIKQVSRTGGGENVAD